MHFNHCLVLSHFIIVDNNDAGEDVFNKVFKRIRGLVTKKPTKTKQWIKGELKKNLDVVKLESRNW